MKAHPQQCVGGVDVGGDAQDALHLPRKLDNSRALFDADPREGAVAVLLQVHGRFIERNSSEGLFAKNLAACLLTAGGVNLAVSTREASPRVGYERVTRV